MSARSGMPATARSPRDPVVVGFARTPFAKAGPAGALREVRSDDLGVAAVSALVERSALDPGALEEVVMGSVEQFGEQAHPGRNVGVLAGLPFEVAGLSVERACATAMASVQYAAMAIRASAGDFFVAGGMESMSHYELPVVTAETDFEELLSRQGTLLSMMSPNPAMFDRVDPLEMIGGLTAEKLADRFGISREAQDHWALRSNERALAAQASGLPAAEIVRVKGLTADGSPVLLERDDCPRPGITLERISSLPTPFRPNGGTVSSASCSRAADGAAAVMLASREAAERRGLTPLAAVRSVAVTGVDPTIMGYGNVPASRKALARAGIRAEDVDLWEINEAFSVVVLVAIEELGLDPERVNVNGGACSMGHPVGASGARLVGTLALEMQRRGSRYGVASICAGFGQGAAIVLESEDAP
ncbi:MAG: thiolase family protein [Acidimicrobiales bacterium]